MSSTNETKTYKDHLEEAKKNSKIKSFVELSDDPRLVELDRLVRTHAKSHFDAFPEISHKISTDEQYKEAYRKFCSTRETNNPIIEDIIKPMADYWFMRRNLERYVHVWRSCLDSYCDDVVLFA